MKKYLYGKLEHLGVFLDGGDTVPENRGIRFCDIIHYKTMENEMVRDDESRRVFSLDKERFTFEVNGRALDSHDMSDHPEVVIAVPRCYCLCLSNKKDDAVMFERFKADVCIEVDVDFLVTFIVQVVAKRFPVRVLHGPINYYPKVMASAPPIEEALIFYKEEELYSIEAEYRIALVFPEAVYFIAGEDRIDVLKGEEPSYMQIGHKDRSFWSRVFTQYTRLSGLNRDPAHSA
ncbi:hypothetical protein [Pseudomonas plecoglossicida]|uniref:hypothetical protein n=1 Tax=Pseudomonas plecoglossicida TaxID=70775 RepID=UPI0015E41107|nr:hypothetical protein [Pseudomonas plecoglossicida]MBA1321221.1 hypothetical protein [Pseudomonas plecoglossicida]